MLVLNFLKRKKTRPSRRRQKITWYWVRREREIGREHARPAQEFVAEERELLAVVQLDAANLPGAGNVQKVVKSYVP